MGNLLISEFIKDFKSEYCINSNEGLSFKCGWEKWVNFVNLELWSNRFDEDRDIEIEDLSKGGIVYELVKEFNDNKLVIEEEMNMVWYEYSYGSFVYDTFVDGFKLFSEEAVSNELLEKE